MLIYYVFFTRYKYFNFTLRLKSGSGIKLMAEKPTKVILFRLIRHFANSVQWKWMQENGVVSGNIQTIRKIDDIAFRKLISYAE
mgnify:CR=1 FL=1